MTSPTARSLAWCRQQGWTAAVVEQTIPHTFIKRDFLGFADLIVLAGGAIAAVQVTSGSNHAARRAKILAEPRAVAWTGSGGLIWIWSWAKTGPRGKRKVWTLRREEIQP